jgi:lycopene cyclase domain-containing protein
MSVVMHQEKTGMEYLLVMISVFLICTAVKLRYRLQMFNSAKECVLVLGSLFVIGSCLDSFALLRGYWNFEEKFFVGIKIGVMPLEEYLFMLVIPFLTLTVYRLVKEKISI